MKSSVYLNKTAEELFQRAKEYDPEYSLSMAVEEGLTQFVEKMNIQFTGMEEQIATLGSMDCGDFYGTKAKFIGKKLAHERIGEVEPDIDEYQTVYLTKKGKYLVQYAFQNATAGEIEYKYEICHSVKELQEKASPILLTKAGKTAGELLPDLDI